MKSVERLSILIALAGRNDIWEASLSPKETQIARASPNANETDELAVGAKPNGHASLLTAALI